MTIKLEVAYGIVEAITDLRKGDDLEDFTVIVDGISVRCHRFILGACSLFFRALFRSGMKEDGENCATLKTVSHPTFTLILSALYTGCDILTEENVIDVWRATHMLEIGFLVRECEAFVEQNISIDNFRKIYETAKLLDSAAVLRTEHTFMTQNFDLVRTSQSQTLLKLSFSEICALVDTDKLVTSSEDNVVESILQWVSYVSPKTYEQVSDSEVTHDIKNEGNDSRSPVATAEVVFGAEERPKKLLSLISKFRSCLLSPKYLEKLLSNPIIVDNPAIRSIMLKAMHYQLQAGHRHGQWPSAAVHRSDSKFKNVVVYAACGNYRRDVRHRDGVMRAKNFSTNEEYLLLAKASSGKLTAFDNELYELNNDGLYIFRDNSWKKIVSCQLSDKTFMIPLENLIYFLDGSKRELASVNPKAKTPVMEKHSNFPEEFTVAGAAKYQDIIMVFSVNISEEDTRETVVHTFAPRNDTWARLENMEGPAEDIISFHNDDDTFLLQTNGNLWKVTNDIDGSVKIDFFKKAWDFNWELYGAVTFRNELIIFGGEMPKDKHISFSLPGSYRRVHPLTAQCKYCITPIILPSEYLKKEEQ